MKIGENFKWLSWLLVVTFIFSSMPVYATETDAVVEEADNVQDIGEAEENETEAAAAPSVNKTVAALNDVEINASNFPDTVFRAYVIEQFDDDGNSILTDAEREAVTEINVFQSGVASLQGIAFFANLERLICHANEISELDISKNSKLSHLMCASNNLSALDLSGNPELTYVECGDNDISALDVSKNLKLGDLRCYMSNLSKLDVSKNLELSYLICYENEITDLDVSKNLKLEYLWYSNNKLSTLDVSSNAALVALDGTGNQMTDIVGLGSSDQMYRIRLDSNEFTTLPDLTKLTLNPTDWDEWAECFSFQSNYLTEQELRSKLPAQLLTDVQWLQLQINNQKVLPSYKINYVLNGGKNHTGNPSQYAANNAAITLNAPTRSGYKFAGWYSEADYRTLCKNIPANSRGTLTFYAKWDATKYTLAFNANGGSVKTKSKTVTYGSTCGTLPTPARSGYKFVGWYMAKTGGNKITEATKVSITTNRTAYAHWAKNSTLTFNANGGSVKTKSKTVTYGSTCGTLPTPTRKGYKFVGWYMSKTGGNKITASTRVTITTNRTAYAHWTANKYTLGFNANGGSVKIKSKAVTYGSTCGTLPTPTRKGYKFVGWYMAKTGGNKITSSTKVSITSNRTAYARWTANKYTLNFNANGGSVKTKSKTVTYGSTCGTLPTPTRKGYEFVGWYMAKTGGNKISSTTKVTITSNRTVYARWKK